MACQQQHPLTPGPSRPIFGLTACLLSPNSSRAGRTTKHEPNRPTDRPFRCRTHGTHTPARRGRGGGAAAQLKRQRLAKTEAKFWGVDWTNERRTEMTTFETLRPSARRAPPRAASSGRRAAFSVASAVSWLAASPPSDPELRSANATPAPDNVHRAMSPSADVARSYLVLQLMRC